MSEVISHSRLRQLVDGLLSEGKRVAGPRQVKATAAQSAPARADAVLADPRDLVLYGWLESSSQLRMEGFIRPANSIKEFVFPRHEKLYGYRYEGKRIELIDLELPTTPQIIIGARPCDAATLPILDHLFNWDYKDALYNRRRELTTVVTLACREFDEHCFCTSVGSGPDDERGSDAVLIDLGDGYYEVCCLTPKGTQLFAGHTEHSEREGQLSEGPAKDIDLTGVRHFLDQGYETPAWQAMTLRCLGCGACAFTCPTCHCFDMIDEGNSAGGSRVRNWDACQFVQFTAHASGHNPRNVQPDRQRQRIYHKFQIYKDKFGETLCTGCGNCSRNCPVGLGVRPVLEAIGRDSGQGTGDRG